MFFWLFFIAHQLGAEWRKQRHSTTSPCLRAEMLYQIIEFLIRTAVWWCCCSWWWAGCSQIMTIILVPSKSKTRLLTWPLSMSKTYCSVAQWGEAGKYLKKQQPQGKQDGRWSERYDEKKKKQEVFIGSSGSKLLLLSFLSCFPECLSSDFV